MYIYIERETEIETETETRERESPNKEAHMCVYIYSMCVLLYLAQRFLIFIHIIDI